MSYGTLQKQVILDLGLIAAGTIPAHRFVKDDGNGKAVLCGDGEAPLGVSDERATEGETVRVITAGIVPVKVGTAAGISTDTLLAVGADGQADVGTSGDPAAGIAKLAASADGDIIPIRVDDIITSLVEIA